MVILSCKCDVTWPLATPILLSCVPNQEVRFIGRESILNSFSWNKKINTHKIGYQKTCASHYSNFNRGTHSLWQKKQEHSDKQPNAKFYWHMSVQCGSREQSGWCTLSRITDTQPHLRTYTPLVTTCKENGPKYSLPSFMYSLAQILHTLPILIATIVVLQYMISV